MTFFRNHSAELTRHLNDTQTRPAETTPLVRCLTHYALTMPCLVEITERADRNLRDIYRTSPAENSMHADA